MDARARQDLQRRQRAEKAYGLNAYLRVTARLERTGHSEVEAETAHTCHTCHTSHTCQDILGATCRTRRVKIRQRCALTARPRSASRRYGLARQTLRMLTRQGKVRGLRRAEWLYLRLV